MSLFLRFFSEYTPRRAQNKKRLQVASKFKSGSVANHLFLTVPDPVECIYLLARFTCSTRTPMNDIICSHNAMYRNTQTTYTLTNCSVSVCLWLVRSWPSSRSVRVPNSASMRTKLHQHHTHKQQRQHTHTAKAMLTTAAHQSVAKNTGRRFIFFFFLHNATLYNLFDDGVVGVFRWHCRKSTYTHTRPVGKGMNDPSRPDACACLMHVVFIKHNTAKQPTELRTKNSSACIIYTPCI